MKGIHKYCLLLLIHLSFYNGAWSQLTLLNWDFSLADTCPVFVDEFDLLDDWVAVTGAPDFYDCDFTFLIDHPVSDYDPGVGKYVGIKVENDSLQTADSFGQTLSQPILPGTPVEIRFTSQTVYGGAYKNDCAGVALWGVEAPDLVTTELNNISELEGGFELGVTDVYTHWSWTWDTLYFIAPDTINALVFSPQLVPGCRQYFFIDQILIESTVGVKELEEKKVKLFPVPAKDQINIDFPSSIQGSPFSIYSISGNLVSTGVLADNSIDISNLPKGSYFIRIETEKEMIHAKFIVE